MLDFKGPYDVVILAGQSNAEGCGLGECSAPYEVDERVVYYKDEKQIAYKFIEGQDAILLVGDKRKFRLELAKIDGPASFAPYFAREYIRRGLLQEGRKLLIVYTPVGGTGFSARTWVDGNETERRTGLWTMDGPLYKRMLDATDEAMAMHPENKLVAFLWHQGESDAWFLGGEDDEGMIGRYQKNFAGLVDSVRQRYGEKDLPIVAGEFVRRGWYEENKRGSECIFEATRRVLNERGGKMVTTAELDCNDQVVSNGDTIHFCHESLRILGEKYCAALAEIL